MSIKRKSKTGQLNKAVFLDRDGTLIVDHGYIKDPDNVELLPGVLDALKLLLDKGFLLFIVSNQSGVGRGIMTMDDVNTVNKRLLKLIGGEKIKEILICPHAPEEACGCRKPAIKLVDKIFRSYNIDPVSSYSVGDKDSDRELATRFGGTGIKLGENGLNTLLDAAKFILKKENR